mgnify:CR=1 FL=1
MTRRPARRCVRRRKLNLFAYRNPGEDINQAVSINGQPYTSLPNAFKYRTEFNPSCACKAAGQTWSDALKSVDDKAAVEQQGDIIVTEESAKKMQQRAQQPAKSPRRPRRAPPPRLHRAAASPPERSRPRPIHRAAPADRPIRTVGPTFIPPKQ